MQIQLSPRRLMDVMILILLVTAGLRLAGVMRIPPVDTSPVTALTPPVESGDILRLPGVEWSAPRTVVLMVSSKCPACIANVPFYRQVVASAAPQLQVVAVSEESQATIGAWLRENQVNVTSTHIVSDASSHGLILTPMLLILDAEGRITDLMIRRLGASDQARVLDRIRNPKTAALDNSQGVREISTNDLKATASSRPIHIVDVRSREQFLSGHRDGATNIPYSELGARALVELDPHVPVIIDCLQPVKGLAPTCRAAAWTLVDTHFADVSILAR